MTRLLFVTAFLLGAAAIVWMGADFVGSDPLALAVTAVIALVYIIGLVELIQFRRATATLSGALSCVPARTGTPADWLENWLGRLDPSLQNAVRLRIEGERVGLPAPVFTPYMVGLLVMLGLLGTFVGMVETLSGAVMALEGTTELEAIRAGLAAPIKGLGVAFGTSVAGVAASAMLGLNSTLCRRDRMLATRQLDSQISTVFRDFSLTYNRQETFKALQQQAQALPAVADKLQSLAEHLERMGDTLGDKLLANQNLFHESVNSVYSELAGSVDKSLRESLAESGRVAGESIAPVVTGAMENFSREAIATQQQVATTARDQLAAFKEKTEETSSSMVASFDRNSSAWIEQTQRLQDSLIESMATATREMAASTQATSESMLGEVAALLQTSEQLIATRQSSEASWLDSQKTQMEHLTSALKIELGSLRNDEERRAKAAAQRQSELEATVATHLAQLGKELEEPMVRLIETASETPRAAAEVIGLMREEISNNIERDNKLLEERSRIMDELGTLAGSLALATAGQNEAIENLVRSSAGLLEDVGGRFGDQVAAEASKMSALAANFAGSTTEISSLGESFGIAVGLFNDSNEKLMEHLSRIEASMDSSTSRSDEQMAYYVAQAREIIDHSTLTQREIIEELRSLGQNNAVLASEAG